MSKIFDSIMVSQEVKDKVDKEFNMKKYRIHFHKWKFDLEEFGNEIFPLKIDSLPVGTCSFTVNNTPQFVNWVVEFIERYGDGGYIEIFEYNSGPLLTTIMGNINYRDAKLVTCSGITRYSDTISD